MQVTDSGSLRGITSRRLWSHAFGERDDAGNGEVGRQHRRRLDYGADRARQPSAIARERLDTFLLAQRVLRRGPELAASGKAAKAVFQRTVEAVRGLSRFPALMLTLERSGLRGVDAYAAAARLAERLEHEPDSLALTQSAVAIVDRAHSVSAITTERATELLMSLLDLDVSGHGSAARVVEWLRTRLLIASENRPVRAKRSRRRVVGHSRAGRSLQASPAVIEWEGRRYVVDSAAAERARLTQIRKGQGEVPLDRAFERATSPAGIRDLAQSLTALIYAVAIGEPDGAALAGGPVWRRHRFVVEGPGSVRGHCLAHRDGVVWLQRLAPCRIASRAREPLCHGWRFDDSTRPRCRPRAASAAAIGTPSC